MTKIDLLNTNLTIEDVISRINAGANVNQTHDLNKKSPLHIHQNIDILKMLIKHQANINHQDYYDKTPLCYVDYGNSEKGKLLLQNGANIEINNDNGYLTLFCNNNYPVMFDLLLRHGADIHAKNCFGANILHHMYNIRNLKLCIKNGLDVNQRDMYGDTPLHILSREENFDAIEYLLANGAFVNALNKNNETPLNIAVFRNSEYENIGTISILLRKNANPNIPDKYGTVPLSYSNNDKIKKLLIEHGAVPATVEFYQENRELFSKEQQKAFDAYASLTSMDNDFFQMCLAYQNGIKNNISMEIQDVELSINH